MDVPGASAAIAAKRIVSMSASDIIGAKSSNQRWVVPEMMGSLVVEPLVESRT